METEIKYVTEIFKGTDVLFFISCPELGIEVSADLMGEFKEFTYGIERTPGPTFGWGL